MESLTKELNTILDVVPSGSRIAFLDYPVYANIGDILVMKGTERFFQTNKMNIICQYSCRDYSPKIRLPRDTILVFQGGGNFGDLYPISQNFREYFIKNYKKNKIVILPQTIYFKNRNKLKQSAELFSTHPDAHIFVRDKYSFKLAKRFFGQNIYLAPDMAHALWPIRVPKCNFNESRCLYLLRNDKERRYESTCHPKKDDLVTDWPLNLGDQLSVGIEILLRYINKYKPIFPVLPRWNRLTSNLVNKVIKVFSKYSTIVSSRLHGHLLACLMDKPNIILDNSYGKNSAYFKTWTYQVPNTTFSNKCADV